MDSASSISRIYDLKTIGVQQVISDLDSVYARIEKISAAKKKLSEAQSIVYDPNILSQVTSQIDKLNNLQGETISQLKELNTTTKQGVTAQSEFAASIAKTATEQKGANVAMDQAAQAMGNNLSATTAGFTKMQASLSSATRTGIDYDTALMALGGRLATLNEELAATGQQLKILGDEYRNNAISEEEYSAESAGLTIQLQQQKTQITEVTAAMTALNKVYNPALIGEENAQLALNREELLQRTNLLKLQAKEDLAVAGSIDEARAQAALYRKELNALDLTTEQGIARQKELIETIAEHDLFIKSNADLYTRQKINIGNYPNPQAELSAIRSEMGKFLAAGGSPQAAEFQKFSARAKELTAALEGVKAATVEATNVGDKMTSMFERMGLRMVLNMFVFQAAIEGAQVLYEHIMKDVEGTEQYIKKQEEFKKANDEVVKSFSGLSDEISHYTELQGKLNLMQISPENQDKIDAILNNTVAGYKRREDAIKALGTANGEVYNAETNQLKAANEVRQKELELLQRKHETISKIQSLIASAQGLSETPKEWDDFLKADGYGQKTEVSDLFKSSDIPDELKKQLVLTIKKGIADGGSISKILEEIRREYAGKNVDTTEEIKSKSEEAINAETAYQSKIAELTYTRNIELQQQLRQLKSQYRAISEKEDIETVDKIVGDTHYKYQQMTKDVERIMKELAKHFKDHVLPDKLKDDFADITGEITKTEDQDTKNQIYEKAKKDYDTYTAALSQIANADAAISKHDSDYGFVNYGKMTDALDKEATAKKIAIENQFNKQAANINDSNQLAELERQRVIHLEQVDQDSYKKRLSFASDYFKRLTQNTTDASAIIVEQIETIATDRLTAIINRGGDSITRGRNEFAANHSKVIDRANQEIVNAESILPDAKEATAKAKLAMDQAQGVDQLTIATRAYNQALKEQADIEAKLSKAKNDKAVENDKIVQYQREINKAIADTMLDTARTLSNGYMDYMAKQDAFHEAMAQRSLAWNQRVMNSEVQSKNELIAQQKATMIAEQQLSKEKMQHEKQRAISQAIINEGLAATQIMVNSLMSPTAKAMPDGGLTLALLAEGASLAAFTAQIAAISSAPAYAGGFNPIKNLAWVGDGGESELMKIGNSWSVSPSTPTLIDSTGLQSVTPMSQVTQYRGTMGAQLQAPAFHSNNTSGSGSSNDVQALYGIVATMGNHISNLSLNYDPSGAEKANRKMNTKRRTI